jgi:toxin FitB
MQAMLDTCIVIDFESYHEQLPTELGLSAAAFAELCGGVVTASETERDARAARLGWARTFFDPLSFDHDAAKTYGRMVGALRRVGRNERSRVADLMIAATAASHNVPLYTNNAHDFVGLDQLVEIIVI